MHAILIVDGSEGRRIALRERLCALTDCSVREAAGLEVAVEALAGMDLALVDADVDGTGAASIVSVLRARRPGMPVIVVAPRNSVEDVPAALDAGALTVLPRDASGPELGEIVRAALNGRGLLPTGLVQSILHRDARMNGDHRRDHAAIEALAAAVEAKDQTTHRHLLAVARLARELASVVEPALALSEDFHSGCLLHDVGKIGVPESILTKPGPLTEEEWVIMRAHPLTGVRVIHPLDLAGVVHDVVLHHHERWDGRGYPHGLAGDEIPLAARIFSVCDALDAMTSHRPYRRALPEEEALDRVREGAGGQFDPEVVAALERGIAEGPVRPWRRGARRGTAATLPRS